MDSRNAHLLTPPSSAATDGSEAGAAGAFPSSIITATKIPATRAITIHPRIPQPMPRRTSRARGRTSPRYSLTRQPVSRTATTTMAIARTSSRGWTNKEKVGGKTIGEPDQARHVSFAVA